MLDPSLVPYYRLLAQAYKRMPLQMEEEDLGLEFGLKLISQVITFHSIKRSAQSRPTGRH